MVSFILSVVCSRRKYFRASPMFAAISGEATATCEIHIESLPIIPGAPYQANENS
jgi:hypothetical protein